MTDTDTARTFGVGDRVVRRREQHNITRPSQIGTVEQVFHAHSPWGRRKPGWYAQVRFRGTWKRWDGGRGDAVLIMRLDSLVPAPDREAANG
jgi:hypothetical protein